METGRASKTALGVAIRRAAHQLADKPPVLDDPIALRLVGEGYPRLMERALHPVGRDFRGFMAARSRYAEDRLSEAVARGVTQYVVLGAGLDTFAYRNPFPGLRVFEVDFPATQVWKRAMLEQAAIALPSISCLSRWTLSTRRSRMDLRRLDWIFRSRHSSAGWALCRI